jgi:hypothetical protein
MLNNNFIRTLKEVLKMVKCKFCEAPMNLEDVSEESNYFECPDCGELAVEDLTTKKVRWNDDV